jgi:glycerol-3-phosphate dehydrogenase
VPQPDTPVAIIGGGVVGAAVAYTLARRGVESVLLEAEDELALGASGTNSGILHTGFDSPPGELETGLILRAAELRDSVVRELGVRVLHCGALLVPHGDDEARVVAGIADGARANAVEVHLRDDGTLEIPGESVTDPVAYTHALARAAVAAGSRIRTEARVDRIARLGDDGLALGLAAGGEVTCNVAVNCAGLRADAVARLAGDDSFSIYPRKGEFFVFDAPEPLGSIQLPVPTKRTKGVLVFPTLGGRVVAGPTAVDQEDKDDWSVRRDAQDEVMAKARSMWPPLEDAEPIAAYAGLRPAGRAGVNYLIGPSPACPGLINVAAIRSTGLTASLGIGEYVAALVEQQGVELGADRALPPGPPVAPTVEWWRRTAMHRTEVR